MLAPDSEVDALAASLLDDWVVSEPVRNAACEAARAIIHHRNVSKMRIEEMNRIATHSTVSHRFDEWFNDLAWVDWRRIPRNPDPAVRGLDVWKPFMPSAAWLEHWVKEFREETTSTETELIVRAMTAVFLNYNRSLVTLGVYERKARSRCNKLLNRLDYFKLEAKRGGSRI
ncbi:hypothetical protein [Aestuariivirga sp.]|uniref:hypothetical protein n=1 Tax=Aestuariivirga sp. TaxID=2650926 RepID=UPI0035943E69